MNLLRIMIAAVVAITTAMAVTCVLLVQSLGPLPAETLAFSQSIVDHHDRLLRAYALPDGRWRLPATVDDVDPTYLRMLLAYEDRRFHQHPGIDPLALSRAAGQWLSQGHILSGGSTITMQVARLLEPRRVRGVGTKLRQMARALQLEWSYSKKDIIGLYLSLAPFGGNIEGVRAASLIYFGKEPRRLTVAEAALLVALPQSPERRRPDRQLDSAERARDRVFSRIAAAGAVPMDEIALARQDVVVSRRHPMPSLAPHAADQARAVEPGRTVVPLTIEAPLQRTLEGLARDRARQFGPSVSVAIMAIDHQTGEVRARVASADYFDADRAGRVDMTRAARSPGSTLKPFIYGVAFEDGLIHPETLIDDRPVRYGSYAPENFDLTFQGTVTIRRALQLSLNVPAVAVLDRLGVARLSSRLTQAGASLVLPKGEAPGLAMGLGGVGVRLDELTMLYAAIARGGEALPLHERALDGPAEPRRLLEPTAAWYVGNILLGTPPSENAPHGRIAFKTGTSYGFRDAWAIGFDGRMTVGVWVGRPDGAPVPGLVGRTAAAPILFDAFARSGRFAALPRAPQGALIASTDRLPPPLQRFRHSAVLGERADPPKIMFPPNGARLDAGAANEPLALKFAGGVQPVTILVNGTAVDVPAGRKTAFFKPDGAGFARLTIMDARGATDSVVVRIR